MRSRRWSSKCDDRPRCRFFRRRAPAGCLFFGVVNNALPALRRAGSAQVRQRMKTSVSTSDDVALLLAVEGRAGAASAARDDRRSRPIGPRGLLIVRARAAAGGDRPAAGEFAAAAAHHVGAGGAGGRVCRAGRARLTGRRGAPCDGLGEMAPGARFADSPRDVSADEGGVTSGDGNMGGRLMLPRDGHHAESGPEQANVTRPNVCTALRCLRAPAWRQWQVSLPPR